jgi:hypothetical protein
MTKARLQHTINRPLPQHSEAASAAAHAVDVCELLVAELRARRARLQKLLQLVQSEAIRLSVDTKRTRQRTHRPNGRMKRPG